MTAACGQVAAKLAPPLAFQNIAQPVYAAQTLSIRSTTGAYLTVFKTSAIGH